MNTEPIDVVEAAEETMPAAENGYLVVGLAAIVVLGVALLQSGADRWAVAPTLIGAAGLAFRWRSAPLVLLAATAFSLLLPYWWYAYPVGYRPQASLAADLGLCGAALAYVVAQYRLFGLSGSLFPPDPRRKLDKPPPRDPERVPAREVPATLVAVAAATVGAFFLWELLSGVRPVWGMGPSLWRLALLVWVVGAGLIVTASVLGHLGWRRLSADEASLYLRDTLWHETRREQRRIQRWRAWALRRERKT